MHKKPKVSVLVPTKNRSASLDRCLGSLVKQSFADFEVVIVDGGSVDETIQVAKNYFGKLHLVLETEKGGLVAQENKGWQVSNGEIVIRTDDDIIATPEWLKAIVETFMISDEIGGATGPTIVPEERRRFRDLFFFQEKLKRGGLFWRILGKVYFDFFMERQPFTVGRWFKCGAFSLGANYPQCLNLTRPIEVDHHEACNLAIRKILLDKIGGFDETYVGIGEYNEADVSFKIREIGYKIMFSPKAAVYHLPSKEGFFKDRSDSYGRVLNFINFYFEHIKPDTTNKFVRFFSYLLFLNGFWIYKFATTRQASQLGCLKGTIVGLAHNISK